MNIIKLIKGYGGNIAAKLKKKQRKKHHHNTTYSELCKKDLECKELWEKFLVKRKVFQIFAPNDYEYAGCSKVVVTSHTPLVLSYETKSQKVVITFYIQRYDKNDIAVDATD